MANKSRKTTNWEAELNPEELLDKKIDSQTIKTVLLKGLQRLAEEAGIVKSSCQLLTHPGIVQCVYTTEFDDGTIWVGCADSCAQNTQKPYVNYLTAVAESRAEARSLRKALRIRILSSEEIDISDPKEISPNKGIDPSVVKAIEQLCDSKNVNKAVLLTEIIPDKQRANSIFELKYLTLIEGQKAMEYLNSLPEKKKEKKK